MEFEFQLLTCSFGLSDIGGNYISSTFSNFTGKSSCFTALINSTMLTKLLQISTEDFCISFVTFVY